MTHRTPWSALPPEVVQAIEAELGAPIIGVREAAEGFSSTLAATITLADDTRYFVKAASTDPEDRVGIVLEREARVVRQLPPSVPTPSLELELVQSGWRVAVFQHIDGRLVDDPQRLFAVIDDMHNHLHAIRDVDARPMRGDVPVPMRWAELTESGAPFDALAELEARWIDAADGDTLLHFDLRDDNVLIDRTDKAWVVDWANAAIGAPEMEVACVLPGIARRFGIASRDIWQACRTSRDRDPRDFLPWWIAHAGVLVHQVVVAPSPRIDPQRDMARPWAEILLAWSQELGGDALRIPTLDEIAVVVARNSERGLGA